MNIRRYLGIPYKSHSCSFDGVDCYQLVRLFNREELGKDLPDYKELYKNALKHDDASGAFAKGSQEWDKVEEPQLGDLILFRDRGVVSHSGVYIDDEVFLHIRENGLSCLEPLDSVHWGKRLEGIIRWN